MESVLMLPKLKVLSFLIQDKKHICADLKYIYKAISLTYLESITGAPVYVAGLLNFAGESIPVIDLAMYLGWHNKTPYSLNTPILLCTDDKHWVGIVVEEVLGIATLDPEALQMHDEFKKPGSLYLAVAQINSDLSLLVDMEQILSISLTMPIEV